jgi:hypothetical protein
MRWALVLAACGSTAVVQSAKPDLAAGDLAMTAADLTRVDFSEAPQPEIDLAADEDLAAPADLTSAATVSDMARPRDLAKPPTDMAVCTPAGMDCSGQTCCTTTCAQSYDINLGIVYNACCQLLNQPCNNTDKPCCRPDSSTAAFCDGTTGKCEAI